MGCRRRTITLLGLILLMASAGGYLLYDRSRPEQQEAQEPLRVAVAVTRDAPAVLEHRLSVLGTISASEMLTVYPLVSGRVTDLPAEVNQTILAGERIASVDPQRFELELDQAEAAYTASRASYERTKRLSELQSTSEQRLDEITAQYEASHAALQLARLQLSYSTITAPISGTILATHLTAGQLISPSVPIVTIADLQNLEVSCQVPQEYRARFLDASSISTELFVGEGPAAIPATIETVSQLIDPVSRSFSVTCRVENPRAVRPGMAVALSFVLDRREEAHTLPLEVLRQGEQLWYVDGESRARRSIVNVRYADATRFAIPKELSGLRVIIQGQSLLEEGQPVSIISTGESP